MRSIHIYIFSFALTGNVGHATFVHPGPKTTSSGPVLTSAFRAERFNVSLPFLSQQAALLYERQLSQVRAGLQKANRLSSGASPTPGSISGSGTAGGYAMTRGGSGGTDPWISNLTITNPRLGSRVPSSLSHRAKERTASHGETSTEFPRLTRRNVLHHTQHGRGSLSS